MVQIDIQAESRLRGYLKERVGAIINMSWPSNIVHDALGAVDDAEKLDPVLSEDWSFRSWLRWIEAMQTHLSGNVEVEYLVDCDGDAPVEETRRVLVQMRDEIQKEAILGGIHL